VALLTCYICHKQFRHDGPGGRPRTCPGECRAEHQRRLRREAYHRMAERKRKADRRHCAHCGAEFTREEGGYRYCSERCLKKATSRSKNAKRREVSRFVDNSSLVDVAELIQRDGPVCCHCGTEFSEDSPQEVDHIIPLSRGGVDAGYNCQLLCSQCNNAKGSGIPLVDLRKARALWPERPNITERDPRRHVLARRKRPASGYRGVSQHNGKWRAKLQFEGRTFRKAGFETPEDAARHYNLLCELLGLGPEYQNEVD